MHKKKSTKKTVAKPMKKSSKSKLVAKGKKIAKAPKTVVSKKKSTKVAKSAASAAKEALVAKALENKTAKKALKSQVDDFAPTTKLASKWLALYNRAQGMETTPYNMKMTFEPSTGLQHKILGWGYILDKKNDRLEVLFKDGIKYLISNYK